ncbi:E1A-binding protein p400-like [Piliocolobus tephrosceles]|uniref:E1A-binding protein p400-like n=1 Tax=Piliocolobus tephrosceles TaxID=591936 RepID=UPI001300D93B|nr:E1A-binding protein p400-like [Piliocolobus tephrosceles]
MNSTFVGKDASIFEAGALLENKSDVEHLIRLQEQKLQLPPPPPPPQTLPGALQPTTQVQVQSPPPTTAEPPAHGSGPRALLTDSTSHLQGPRLMSVLMSQMAQVALATPSVVSVLAVAVLSARVTAPPSTQQDSCRKRQGARLVAQPLHVQQLPKLKHHQQEKAVQPSATPGPLHHSRRFAEGGHSLAPDSLKLSTEKSSIYCSSLL